MENYKDLKFAVLIDADNVPYANVKEMFEEIAKYGTPTFKRIYADWTKPTVSGWKNVLLENAITPIQQYSYSSGKNCVFTALGRVHITIYVTDETKLRCGGLFRIKLYSEILV